MSRTNLKRYLMLLAVIGLVAIASGGGSGTFASFNAEIANNNNIFATGTLFLHQTHTGNICRSEDNGTNANVACDILFASTHLKAGDSAHADITLTNAGTINATASTLGVSCDTTATKPTIATTSTAITASHTYTHGSPLAITLPASGAGALDQTLVQGTQVDLTDGTTTTTLVVDDVSDAPGSTTVNLTGTTTTVPTGALSVKIHAFGTGGFCLANGVQFYVQEMDNTFTTAEKCAVPATGTSCTAEDIATAVTASPNNLTTNQWTGGASVGALDAGTSRYYRVYVQIPPGVGVDNSTQNSQAKFNLDWKIAQ